MKKITFLCIAILGFTWCSHAQFPESFEDAVPPTGWTTFTNGLGSGFDWEQSDEDANTGTFSAFVRYESVTGGDAEDWLVTPAFTPTTGLDILEFFQRQTFGSEYGTTYEVLVSTTSQTDPASFTAIDTQTEADLPFSFAPKYVDLSAYDGQEIYVAFKMTNNNGDNWYIDDVNLVPLLTTPNCPEAPIFPEDMAASVETVENLTFTWSAPSTGDAPSGYEFFLGETSGDLTSLAIVSGTSIEITGLEFSTTYYWRVEAINSGGSTSGCTEWSFTVQDIPGPPANDECADAIALTVNSDFECGTVTNATIVAATDSGANDATCFGTPDDDIWFTFEATAEEHRVSLDNFTSGTEDMYMVFYEGTCDALGDSVFCSDPQTANLTGLTVGTTYYVQVYTWSATAGQVSTFDVCIGTQPQVELDYYSLQFPVSGDITTGDEFLVFAQAYEDGLTNASDEPVEGIEVWIGYSETDSNPNTDADWTWVEAATNDNYDFTQSNDEYFLDLGAELSGGSYFYASRFSLEEGPFTYGGIKGDNMSPQGGEWGTMDFASGTVTVTDPPPPAYDDIANALSITVDEGFCDGSNTNATNAFATGSDEGVGDCFNGDNADNDVWFTFTVPATTATVNVSTDFTGGTLVDTEMSVYSGTPGALTELECSQDEGTTTLSNGFSWNSLITDLDVTAGETYYIQVAGYGTTSFGTFCLAVETNQTLSASEFELDSFTYFPNPINDQLHLKAQSQIDNVTIFNMLGQEVLNVSPKSLEVDVQTEAFKQGAYFAKVTIGNSSKTIKLIKN